LPTYKAAKRKLDRAEANWKEKAISRKQAMGKWIQSDLFSEEYESLCQAKDKAFQECDIATDRYNYCVGLVLNVIKQDIERRQSIC